MQTAELQDIRLEYFTAQQDGMHDHANGHPQVTAMVAFANPPPSSLKTEKADFIPL